MLGCNYSYQASAWFAIVLCENMLKDVYVQAKTLVSGAHGLLVILSEVIHAVRFI